MPLLDTTGGASASALPVQFVDIKITPLLAGFGLEMTATFLDEELLEFVGQDLATERVETLDHALALIASNLRSTASMNSEQPNKRR